MKTTTIHRQIRPETRRVLQILTEPEGTDTVEFRAQRPTMRGECVDGPRPCPWVSCKWHLAIDVRPNGSLGVSVPPFWEPRADGSFAPSCALDVADEGGKTLEEIGDILGTTRERIRQIEAGALEQLRPHAEAGGAGGYSDEPSSDVPLPALPENDFYPNAPTIMADDAIDRQVTYYHIK